MKKRIVSLITVVAVMVSLCAITANAAVYGNHDFDADGLDLNDKTVYKKSDIPADAVFEITHEDGAVHYYKEAGVRSADDAEWQFSLPDLEYGAIDEFILQYDYMIPDYDAMNDTDNLYSDIYFAGVRQSWFLYRHRFKSGSGGRGRAIMFSTIYPASEGGHEGKWITIAHHYYKVESSENPIPWKCDVYIKPQGAAEWTVKSEDHALSSNASDRVRFFIYGDYKMNAYLDNFKVYTGTNVIGEKIVSGDDVITGVEEVIADDLTISATVLADETKTALRKIMVAYDKSGKMIDFKSGTQNITLGSNKVSEAIELDAAEAATVADGGYVGLYLWDGMLPYINAIEIK